MYCECKSMYSTLTFPPCTPLFDHLVIPLINLSFVLQVQVYVRTLTCPPCSPLCPLFDLLVIPLINLSYALQVQEYVHSLRQRATALSSQHQVRVVSQMSNW